MIWLQTGLCMVAVRGEECAEAAEAARSMAPTSQLFFRITIPYIRGSIITIAPRS
jgi:ABC-type spermidine/putrescine transport system permease subunit II